MTVGLFLVVVAVEHWPVFFLHIHFDAVQHFLMPVPFLILDHLKPDIQHIYNTKIIS